MNSSARDRAAARRGCSGGYVVVEGDEAGGYSAWSPDLLGCVAAAGYEECVAQRPTRQP
ncbi:MAG: type II toxin-antitoxin system HicB family antitoxin [Pseudonocardiaceae bacterium]